MLISTVGRVDGGVTTIVYRVPETWLDENLRYFLYPQPDFTVGGVCPWDWGEISYKKRRYPEDNWVERDVCDIVTESAGKTLITSISIRLTYTIGFTLLNLVSFSASSSDSERIKNAFATGELDSIDDDRTNTNYNGKV